MAKLLDIPWIERHGLSIGRRVRMVKMVRPLCAEGCANTGRGWWENCTHDPYHSTQEVPQETPNLETDENGNTYVTGKTTKVLYKRIPNISQVALTTRIRSKLGVQAQLARGWKFPADVDPGDGKHTGYSAMCEFRDCYAPNPKVKTEAGSYCSPNHAKAILMKERGLTQEVYDKEKARKQLDAVSLS